MVSCTCVACNEEEQRGREGYDIIGEVRGEECRERGWRGHCTASCGHVSIVSIFSGAALSIVVRRPTSGCTLLGTVPGPVVKASMRRAARTGRVPWTVLEQACRQTPIQAWPAMQPVFQEAHPSPRHSKKRKALQAPHIEQSLARIVKSCLPRVELHPHATWTPSRYSATRFSSLPRGRVRCSIHATSKRPWSGPCDAANASFHTNPAHWRSAKSAFCEVRCSNSRGKRLDRACIIACLLNRDKVARTPTRGASCADKGAALVCISLG